MGLLDDAIREHLDLKRRRGADPTEVEREEREVLGPVRPRAEAAREEAYAPEDDVGHEPLALEPDPWEEPHSEAVADPEPLPPVAAFDHKAVVPSEPEPHPTSELEPAPFEPVQRDPEPEPYAGAGSEPPDTGQTTDEYSVEDAIEEEEPPPRAADEEDVLEETPDFLQDTPDHDRLWFEQRPPRDFDFDG